MSLRYLTMRTALAAATQSGATTNFNHLRTIPRAWLIRRSKHDPKLKAVRPQDRIKWWNIVPGDQIRLRGDREGTIHEVLSINRLSNRVFLKNSTTTSGESNESPPRTKNYHYSRCQLYVGEHMAIPAKKGEPRTPKIMPVFASRVGTSEPTWSYLRNRFVWKRYAVATVPKLLEWKTGDRLHIPWPPAVKRTYPAAKPYDTTQEALAKITYETPDFPLNRWSPLPTLPAEKEYLDIIYNPTPTQTYDPSAPYEVYLKPDLANPHSRAKKLERFKIRQSIIHAQLKDITDFELANLNGRTPKEAKSDAAFRWREMVKKQQAERKKARWMHTARVETWAKKNANKAKKEERQRRRLTELTLSDEHNQVIPAALRQQHKH